MPEQRHILAASTDEELVAAFQGGQIEAFNVIVGRYKDVLVNFVFRYVGSIDEAEDIVQDTFVRVYKHSDQYQPVAKFSTWLYTIATNLARTQYQKKKRWGLFAFSQKSEDDDFEQEISTVQLLPDDFAESALLHEQIEQALLKLPHSFREVIILFEMEEKTYEEICQITGLNIGTVKSRLSRARLRLQALLKDIHS